MIIPHYSAERRVNKSELIGKENQPKNPTTIATTTKRQQKKKKFQGKICFAKHCCHVNPISVISDPVLFGLEVLDSLCNSSLHKIGENGI